jgi:2-C-methyl-D-erythritol 2,4-cyclodiphosphate synthase
VKVGFGFDAHRLVPGRPLVLAGIRIPFDRGLEGFSDADVIAHAVIDAVLGAAALGDCGSRFPAGDPKYAGAESIGLLKTAAQILKAAGLRAHNVDCVIVAEAPALAPHLEKMRVALAAALGIEVGCCSVKAKRTEGLGFTGTSEGMAAYAVATVENTPHNIKTHV